MDDGKVNALSLTMLGQINDALDKAEADEAVVILTGRSGILSAGFDLGLTAGGPAAVDMLENPFFAAPVEKTRRDLYTAA